MRRQYPYLQYEGRNIAEVHYATRPNGSDMSHRILLLDMNDTYIQGGIDALAEETSPEGLEVAFAFWANPETKQVEFAQLYGGPVADYHENQVTDIVTELQSILF